MWVFPFPLNARGASEDPGRQHDEGGEKGKNAGNGNANEPERQKKDPDDRIEDESQQCQWPTKDEKNQPKQKFRHVSVTLS